MDAHLSRPQVGDPHLRYAGLGVPGQLWPAVLAQRAIGHLDDEVHLRRRQPSRTARAQRVHNDVRFRQTSVIQLHGSLNPHHGPAH